MEPVERLHQCIQGAGADPAVQGDSEAGGISAGGPTFLILQLQPAFGRDVVPSLQLIEELWSPRDRTPDHLLNEKE